MPLTLYMTPGSCSTGIHILLEEIDVPFAAHVVNLPKGEHRQPAFLAVNPRGTIPALKLEDGSALSGFVAIAYWLARRYPKAGLLPTDFTAEARAIEAALELLKAGEALLTFDEGGRWVCQRKAAA